MKLSIATFVTLVATVMAVAGTAKSDTIQIGFDDIITFIAKHQGTENELYSKESHPELYCLAENIYFESRADNLAGQVAVADVVLNRVHDDRYPNTICGVVRQGRYHENGIPRRNQCQFSWWCDGKPEDIHDKDSWRTAQEIAYKIVKLESFRGITEGATHYHATYVDPSWNKNMQLIGRIGSHIFYRQP